MSASINSISGLVASPSSAQQISKRKIQSQQLELNWLINWSFERRSRSFGIPGIPIKIFKEVDKKQILLDPGEILGEDVADVDFASFSFD